MFGRDRRVTAVAVLLAAIVVATVALLVVGDDDGSLTAETSTTSAPRSTTTSSTASSTTSTPSTTSTTSDPTTTTTIATTTTASTTPPTTAPTTSRPETTIAPDRCTGSIGRDEPDRVAETFYAAWTVDDRRCARAIATEEAIETLFFYDGSRAAWEPEDCDASGRADAQVACTFAYDGGSARFELRFGDDRGWQVRGVEFEVTGPRSESRGR